jgi:putative sigma-54 modulation protein|tara:strand:+ start:19517 stop:19801 length:285 start_codon:yes stop_codon:yes gene_type:complete
MRIQIHSIHFDADADLLAFVESKLEKLLTFNQDLQSCEVFLRVDKSDTRENKLVEVKAHLPGKDLFAKRKAVSFESAMDEVSEALRRQVMKVHA